MNGTYVIKKHNGKPFDQNFTFSQVEIENLLHNSPKTDSFVVVNLITRQMRTHDGWGYERQING